ncbi:MAG: cyclopropane-fatty-acyl-phospholipid synthase family protein [Pseudomonadota bacterium]
MKFLPKLLNKALRNGSITLIGPDGTVHKTGNPDDQPSAVVKINDPSLDWKIALNPELKAAEAFMDGGLEIVEGDVYDLVCLFFKNKDKFDLTPVQMLLNSVMRKARRLQQHNPIARSRQNVKHHYDLGDDLFDLFLDDDKQYSCAYFPTGTETLEEAQEAKKDHIARKLCLKPGNTVLDIGCGWGGLAIYLAKDRDARVTGITLSEHQARIARERVKAEGLEGQVEIVIRDYRELNRTFDRIVSVGMLEHVGVVHLKDYFTAVRNMLKSKGVALIHSISAKTPPGITGPFLRKYIFPGGYSPAISEIAAAVELSGLWILDCEVWRFHYGYTLRAWRERFMANRDRAVEIYDERFARMWEFYLASCEASFLCGSSNVVQIQLGREADAVPLSRNYLYQTN